MKAVETPMSEIKVTREYGVLMSIAIVLAFMILVPVLLPVAMVLLTFLFSCYLAGIVIFYCIERVTAPKGEYQEPHIKFQWIRAFINNVIAAHVPHYQARFRRFLYRLTGITIGKGVFIGMNGYMEDYYPEHVIIEDNACVSFRVTFIAHGFKRGDNRRVRIKSGAYVGAGSVILPGVTIGRNALVGAGSVVVKDIPDGAIAAGNPAKLIRWKEGYGPSQSAS